MAADKWETLNNTLERMRRHETPRPESTGANFLNSVGLAISGLPESTSPKTIRLITEAIYAAFQAGRREQLEQFNR